MALVNNHATVATIMVIQYGVASDGMNHTEITPLLSPSILRAAKAV